MTRLWSVKWKWWQMLFSWAPKSLWTVTTAMKLKDTCSLEEKLWQTYTVLKSRDITLPAKFCLVKAMVYLVAMCGCESWTIKKVEHWRIDAFDLWCQRRYLKVSCTITRSNQSVLKEINPEYLLEGLMLKLRLQYFVQLIRRTASLEKILFLGKIEGKRRKGRQRMRWFANIMDSMDLNLNKLGSREAWYAAVLRITESDLATEQHQQLLFYIISQLMKLKFRISQWNAGYVHWKVTSDTEFCLHTICPRTGSGHVWH